MGFLEPQWFGLVPGLVLLGWAVPVLRLWRPLRVLCLVLLVFWMVGPSVRMGNSGVEVMVLVDRSASAEELIAPRLAEWEELLREGMRSGDRLRMIDFAEAPMERLPESSFEGGRNATRMRLALEYGRTLSEPDRQTRMVVLTDGYSTQPLGESGRRLAEAGIELWFRSERPAGGKDSRVVSFDLPEQVRPGEAFPITIEGLAEVSGIPYVLRRADEVIAQGRIEAAGRFRLSFADRIGRSGSHRYEFEMVPETDAYPSNNRVEGWVELAGGDRVVVVTAYEQDPMVDALRVQGWSVEPVADYRKLNPGTLTRAQAVILNNVPASQLPAEFLESLPFFVEEQGGGFLMAGGRFSFGAGGYFGSVVDPLLPISMELKEDLRRSSVALAIVLDRSGSMSAGVAGGMTKMGLANEGAAQAIELLGQNDLVSVHAVDSFAHEIVPLSRTGDAQLDLAERVRSIESGGGGIYVFEGLSAGWEQLKSAGAERKHLILFSDAADSEAPGEYAELIGEMREAGATVSVIALGGPEDPDADLLRDIAERGGGRVFFNADPTQLPTLFSMETVAVARSLFVEEPTQTRETGGWLEISAQPIVWPGAVDGYNLSYLRPEATAALDTVDQYEAPLVAWWNRGAGRAGAIAFPMAGEASAGVRAWSQYGEFLRTFIDWLGASGEPEGSLLRTDVKGEELQIDLFLDDRWAEKLGARLPRLVVAVGSSGDAREVTWSRVAPGHLQAATALPPGDFVRGVASLGADRWVFGPVTGGTDPETAFDPDRPEEMRETARLTGGGELVRFDTVWERDDRVGDRDLRPLLLICLLGAFLAEMLVVRFRG